MQCTDERFEVLWFTAAWSGPCKTLEHVFSNFSVSHPELNIALRKIDASADRESAHVYCINELPTLVVIRNNVETKRGAGLVEATRLLLSLSGT